MLNALTDILKRDILFLHRFFDNTENLVLSPMKSLAQNQFAKIWTNLKMLQLSLNMWVHIWLPPTRGSDIAYQETHTETGYSSPNLRIWITRRVVPRATHRPT